MLSAVLIEAGDLVAARRSCEDGLARCQEAGDLANLAPLLMHRAVLDRLAGDVVGAAAQLRESVQLATRSGQRTELLNCVDECGHLCAATGRWAEALTLWAARAAPGRRDGLPDAPHDAHRRQEPQRRAREALGPAQAREAEQRGAAMSLAIAAEFVSLLTSSAAPAATAPSAGRLTPRERDLVALVARGHTDAQIAAQLSISVRTVRSRLNRIRGKTGCRRRADLTRVALDEGLA